MSYVIGEPLASPAAVSEWGRLSWRQDGGEATLRLHKKGDKRGAAGLRFISAQAIGEYIEKAGITSGLLFGAQEAPRSREKLSKRPMDSATMYVIAR